MGGTFLCQALHAFIQLPLSTKLELEYKPRGITPPLSGYESSVSV